MASLMRVRGIKLHYSKLSRLQKVFAQVRWSSTLRNQSSMDDHLEIECSRAEATESHRRSDNRRQGAAAGAGFIVARLRARHRRHYAAPVHLPAHRPLLGRAVRVAWRRRHPEPPDAVAA